MSFPGSVRHIPNFIKARSESSLRRLMFLNNVKKGQEFQYFDFTWTGKNWVCWYYERAKPNEQLGKKEGDK